MREETKTLRPPLRARRGTADRLRDAVLELCGGQGTVVRHGEKCWASITFAGARHRIELAFVGCDAVAAGEHLIAELPEHEFAIPGRLVAEATVVQADHRLDPPQLTVSCELLVLEDC